MEVNTGADMLPISPLCFQFIFQSFSGLLVTIAFFCVTALEFTIIYPFRYNGIKELERVV